MHVYKNIEWPKKQGRLTEQVSARFIDKDNFFGAV